MELLIECPKQVEMVCEHSIILLFEQILLDFMDNNKRRETKWKGYKKG